MDSDNFLFGWMAGIATILILGAICSPYTVTVKDIKTEAVKKGFAEWIADEEGKVEFKWKDNK